MSSSAYESSPRSTKDLHGDAGSSSGVGGKSYLAESGTAAGVVPRQPTSCLTFSRGWLQNVAHETCEIARRGNYTNADGQTVSIREDLQAAVDRSVHYHSSHEFHPPATPGEYETQFFVAFGSSLNVAEQLYGADKHVGILNSASGKRPDKFLRGTISQEECICRASLLYPCLQKFENRPHHFYYINHKEKYRQNASSCAIFAPHVPVIRRDTVRGDLLDQHRLCSFVNIPSANAFVVGPDCRNGSGSFGDGDDDGDDVDNDDRSAVSDSQKCIPKAQPIGDAAPHEHETLGEAMRDRLFRALSIFHEHGVTDLVLCAFGCGAHGNNPETIAKIFREFLLDDGPFQNHFDNVVFAIQPSRTTNYEAFVSVWPEASAV